MNREIKFRFWNSCGKHSKMFYKTDQVIECLKQQIEFNDKESLALGYNHEGDGSSFMQYTGLKDKNGKDIYEGDILRYSADGYKFENGVVVFSDGCFKVRCTFSHRLNSTIAPLFEVIGHIY